MRSDDLSDLREALRATETLWPGNEQSLPPELQFQYLGLRMRYLTLGHDVLALQDELRQRDLRVVPIQGRAPTRGTTKP
jgi:hypothetical protein